MSSKYPLSQIVSKYHQNAMSHQQYPHFKQRGFTGTFAQLLHPTSTSKEKSKGHLHKPKTLSKQKSPSYEPIQKSKQPKSLTKKQSQFRRSHDKIITNTRRTTEKARLSDKSPQDGVAVINLRFQVTEPTQMRWKGSGKNHFLKKQSEQKINFLQKSTEKMKTTKASGDNDGRTNSWANHKAPYTPQEILAELREFLSDEDMTELPNYREIYYIPRQKKIASFPTFEEDEFICGKGDHIAFRYEIVDTLGKGSYGKVLKCMDHKNKKLYAIKVIRNNAKFTKQALIQYRILNYIKENDTQGKSHSVKLKQMFQFRKHVCMVFELLSENLYELIVRTAYRGLSSDIIRRMAIQLFTALNFLRKHNIIHCDIKPENIVLREFNRSGIQLIDFGSSCFLNQIMYTYIQSRYYRAPEIFLGHKYDHRIDTWSLGCVLCELATGVPLFPGDDELEQLRYMIATLGMPPKWMALTGTRSSIFFTRDFKMSDKLLATNVIENYTVEVLARLKEQGLRNLIFDLIKWDPKERLSPAAALNSEWILQGIPKECRTVLSKSEFSSRLSGSLDHALPKKSDLPMTYRAPKKNTLLLQYS